MLHFQPFQTFSFLPEAALVKRRSKREGKARNPAFPREKILQVFLELRERLGDFGFGPGGFLDFLEGLFPAGTGGKGFFSSSRMEDLYLCLGLLQGSSRAFLLLEREYALRLFQAASRAGFSGEEARDALQETLGELWRRPRGERPSPLEGFRGRGSLFGFLKTILIRRLARREAARKRLASLEEMGMSPRGEGPDPAAQAAGKELEFLFRDLVGASLDTLPPSWKALLLAVHLEGEPATKAALRLGLFSAGASHRRTRASRLHARALAAFRRALLERAHEVYGLHGDEILRLLGKEPLHSPGKRHHMRREPQRKPGPKERENHGG